MAEFAGEIAARVRAGRPLDHIPVIDMHGHLGRSTDYYRVPRPDFDDVVDAMDRVGVDHLLAFCLGPSVESASGNRYVRDACDAHPGRFSSLVRLQARFPRDWIPHLEEGRRRGARGVKLVSVYQGAREEDVDWSTAFEYARDKRWMVLNHDWGQADRLERWAAAFPEIVFIIGHAAFRFADVVRRFDNVYQSLCAAFTKNCSTEEMVARLPVERLLLGSDALDLDFGTAVGPVAFSDIPEDAKERILGGNAVELFRRLGVRPPWETRP